ncbi:MAG: RNA methyltransferase [Paludibacteraceae bacterium]|nr:RNA methyltransferase [Paludibacteraceae bacterium]
MISRSTIQLVRSLERKKGRLETGLFVAEGSKCVGDLLGTFDCDTLIATSEWLRADAGRSPRPGRLLEVTDDELKRVSLMQAPQQVMALFRLPHYELTVRQDDLYLALDDVQDPGNVGTIIRLCDWFGITDLICSRATADAFAPKCVQATMGALARVRVHYTDLPHWLQAHASLPLIGTTLDGSNIYDSTLPSKGIIVMGSEGHGLSQDTLRLLSQRLYIPNFPQGRLTSESLNVAVATAITLAEFRRRQAAG